LCADNILHEKVNQNSKFTVDENNKINNNNIGYNLINIKKEPRRNSILKSPKRNSLEFSDTKIVEELNVIIKNKFNNVSIQNIQNDENEVILNINKPFHKVNNNIIIIFILILTDYFK
jgi:hypothetical protein